MMANEHDERIAQIKARLDARTEGEWWVYEGDFMSVGCTNSEYGELTISEDIYTAADTIFIANAPADMDYLLEHVAKLEAQLDAARDTVAALLEGRRG